MQLFDYLETPSDIFLVMEYCNGGDLGDYLIGGCDILGVIGGGAIKVDFEWGFLTSVAKKTLSENSIRHLSRHIGKLVAWTSHVHILGKVGSLLVN